jgi:hypothetical protein
MRQKSVNRSDQNSTFTVLAGYGLYVAKQTLHGKLFESIDELKGNLP